MKVLFFILFLATYALAETITPDDVKLFRQLCALADEGKYSSKTVQGKAEVNGSVRLLINGKLQSNATLTQNEWHGVQKVLQIYQQQENHDYRECVKDVLPYFKARVTPVISPKPKPIVCKKGEIKVGNQCKPKPIVCKKGEIKVGNQCKPKQIPKPIPIPAVVGCASEIQEIKHLIAEDRKFEASRLKVKAMASDRCTSQQQAYIDDVLQIH